MARELGVSVSTVSKALKESEEISRETKDKIQAYAKTHNYRPNNIALSLKNRRTKNIGVIIPEIVHHFFSTVIKGIEEQANQMGYNLIICVSNESFEKEVINTELLADGSIDGFIMALSGETELKGDYNHLQEVLEQGIPLVLFDRVANDIQCDKVVNDDAESVSRAVEKLLGQGRKAVGLITTKNFFSVSNKREEGYRKAHAQHGLPLKEEHILRLDINDMDDRPLEKFFSQKHLDAILCVNETFAIRAMRVAQQMGIQVPEEMAFLGFTDGILSRYANPTLSTMDQHGEEMGRTAAQMLIERIETDDDPPPRTAVVATTLIERGSTVNV